MKIQSKVPIPKFKESTKEDKRAFKDMLITLRNAANDTTGHVQDYIWVDDKSGYLLLIPEADRDPVKHTHVVVPEKGDDP